MVKWFIKLNTANKIAVLGILIAVLIAIVQNMTVGSSNEHKSLSDIKIENSKNTTNIGDYNNNISNINGNISITYDNKKSKKEYDIKYAEQIISSILKDKYEIYSFKFLSSDLLLNRDLLFVTYRGENTKYPYTDLILICQDPLGYKLFS